MSYYNYIKNHQEGLLALKRPNLVHSLSRTKSSMMRENGNMDLMG